MTCSPSSPGCVPNTRARRANWSYLPSLRWRHDGRVWKTEAGAALARADNNVRNLGDGVFGTTTATRSAVTVSFLDVAYYGPRAVAVTDAAGAAVNPFILDSYAVTQGTGGGRRSDDTRRTAFANGAAVLGQNRFERFDSSLFRRSADVWLSRVL